jgi:hypothetical protein
MATTQNTASGLVQTGGFLRLDEGRAYTRKSGERAGQEAHPVKVVLLDGSYPVTVEYEDMETALGALGGAVPDPLAVVSVPVIASGPWNQAQGRRERVFLRGRRIAAVA